MKAVFPRLSIFVRKMRLSLSFLHKGSKEDFTIQGRNLDKICERLQRGFTNRDNTKLQVITAGWSGFVFAKNI